MSDQDDPQPGPADSRYKPISRDELDDLSLLPRRFELFASEVRDSFAMLGNKILPAIIRFEEALVDIGHRLDSIERWKHATDDRLDRLEAERRATNRKK